MPRIHAFKSQDIRSADYNTATRTDGRELVLFESLVAFLALLLIISGFGLYVGHAFAASDETLPSGAVKIGTQSAIEQPLSLVEA